MKKCKQCKLLQENGSCSWTKLNVFEDDTEYDIDIDCDVFEKKEEV